MVSEGRGESDRGSLCGSGGEFCLEFVKADWFLVRVAVFLSMSPVESGTLREDVTEVRDCTSETSVCAEDTSLDAGITGSSCIEDGAFGAALGFPAFFVGLFSVVSLADDVFDLVVLGSIVFV